MRIGRNMPPLPVPKPEKNARRHGRVRCQHLMCSLGRIVDLSASGLSARTRAKPLYKNGQPIVVTVEGFEGPFDLPARVVWVRKVGFRNHEVGITFLAVSEQARAALIALGRAAASNETIGPAGISHAA